MGDIVPPLHIVLEDGEVIFRCQECGWECQEDGQCFEHDGPCYYCPPDVCKSCGRGFCDQSC